MSIATHRSGQPRGAKSRTSPCIAPSALDGAVNCAWGKEQVSCLCFLLGLGLLCGPALALRVGNPLARLGTLLAAFLSFLGSLRGLLGFAPCYFDCDFAGAGQQGANLREAGDFGVD